MMTPAPDRNATAPRPPGRLSRALIRMLMKQARVAGTEALAENFRLLTLESPAFKQLPWLPGQKIQITMGSAFVARTFTPIEWDQAAGRTRILGYMHGHGPGSSWLRDASPGDECHVFGPRASLDLSQADGMCIMLGDETSIGLAYALHRQVSGIPLQTLFEVSDRASALAVLARLDLDGVELFERRENDAHLTQIEHRLPALAATQASFILTGRAAFIQRLRSALKSLGVPGSRLKAKAYWAAGKTGLD
ncbi:siderophore-interacting protein [Herbaspirillum lusitanum]|uniref:Siderophore-interacting protein n=1 Tax=Herbaspirillum lusitanum TaxID=213312 RepID=A0ABW9A764_9BURK